MLPEDYEVEGQLSIDDWIHDPHFVPGDFMNPPEGYTWKNVGIVNTSGTAKEDQKV